MAAILNSKMADT